MYKLLLATLFSLSFVFANAKKNAPDSLQTENDYLLAAQNYKQLNSYQSCKNIIAIGLSKFENSALLLNELGEIEYLNNQLDNAIVAWEKGIKANANEPINYYNAAKFHQLKNNIVKVIVFAETFVLLEPQTIKTIEIKLALFDAYKKIVIQEQFNTVSKFEKQIVKQLPQISQIINIKALELIRTKFILNWFSNNKNEDFPLVLFNKHQEIIAKGFAEAYTYWLFGNALSSIDYEKWVKKNKQQYNICIEFLNYPISFNNAEYYFE